MPDREPVGVIGAGWVGLVTAACFAELGHEVHCRDIVAEKVESLSRGEVPIYEPGLSELVLKNLERLHFTTEMIKLASNAFLATKISFINEIANVSEELGADVA